jgi:hypothetical protein
MVLTGMPLVADAAGPPRYKIAFATYLGGAARDQAREVIVYPDSTVLVGAQSSSANMPTTENAVQPEYAGDDPASGHGGVFGGEIYLVGHTASRDFPVTPGAAQPSFGGGTGDA